MPFPLEDAYWVEARDFLQQHVHPLTSILAPNEFLEFFAGTYHYNVTYVLPPSHFEWVVFHKGMLREIEPPFALTVLEHFKPVFANAVFAVYAKTPPGGGTTIASDHLVSLLHYQAELKEKGHPSVRPRTTFASVITTYNRPQSLARSLPQILALGAPVVVLDDGSTSENFAENQRIADAHAVPLVRMPQNRGLCNAINDGVGYWLADPDIDWISYFQDDVDVNPDLFARLAQIQDARSRPLLSGYDAIEHPSYGTEAIAGYTVHYKRSSSGQHLHGHRDYWAAVLPIPTPYLGAPKPSGGRPGQGADEDWWITAWSPHAITKQGGYVVCLPGLVKSFQLTRSGSTWDNTSGRRADGSPLGEPSASSVFASPRDVPPPPAKAAPSDEAMAISLPGSLKGTHILLDGMNLQLPKGTGIKTYGLSLVKALALMDARVEVLLSRRGNRRNVLLDEVNFFDDQGEQRTALSDALSLSKSIFRSALGLHEAWKRKSNTSVVLTEGKYTEEFVKLAASYNLPRCYENANRAFNLMGWVTQVSIPEKMDLWHATYPLPMRLKGAKKITTIHDLIPLRLPYTTLDNKKDFYQKVKSALKDSEVIITVSEHTRQDILNLFDADPDRVITTYQPTTLKPLPVDDQSVANYLKRYRLGYKKYLLFVGAIEPKKNLGRLLEAYAALDTDMKMVVVGKKAWSWEEELGRVGYLLNKEDSPVKLLEYVTFKNLRYLYQGAYCFVFPSLYEGFGLPPIEAMTLGCPVITSHTSCLPEVCGSAALYVDPYEVEDIRSKMETVLSDRSLRDQLIHNGKAVAQRFSMENYLKRLYGAYQKALGR